MYHIHFPDVCEVLRQLLDFIFLSGDTCLELVGPDIAPLPDPDFYCAVAFQKDQKLGFGRASISSSDILFRSTVSFSSSEPPHPIASVVVIQTSNNILTILFFIVT